MTIDKAISHCEEVAQEKRYEYQECVAVHDMEEAMNCGKCGQEHEQLAKWLKELKKLREQTRWIPVSERLPEDKEIILITSSDMYLSKLNPWCGWKNRNNWYTFTANGSYLIKYPIAWMPLPESYREKQSNKVGWSSLENVREKVEQGTEK